MKATIKPIKRLSGNVTAPSDKAISCRAAIFAGIAAGEAQIGNFLRSENTHDTLACLRQLGVHYEFNGSSLHIDGAGARGLTSPTSDLDFGTSVASLRFMAGWLAGESFESVCTGRGRSNERPMGRIIAPLRAMGATVRTTGAEFAPFAIRGGALKGIDWHFEIASGEAKTCLMLAALRASSATVMHLPAPVRDHSERLLTKMGAKLQADGPESLRVFPLERPLHALSFRVPGEISAAVYWLCVAAVHPDADITVQDVCLNPSRTGIIDALRAMGANIEVIPSPSADQDVEPTGVVRVRSSELSGIEIPPEMMPRMIDEIPGFMLAAALAKGETLIRGVEELRNKKSDRIAACVGEFRRLGVDIQEVPEGLLVRGGPMRGNTCSARGDHRMANSLVVAGLVAQGATQVEGAEAIADVSYPGFWEDLRIVAGDCFELDDVSRIQGMSASAS